MQIRKNTPIGELTQFCLIKSILVFCDLIFGLILCHDAQSYQNDAE